MEWKDRKVKELALLAAGLALVAGCWFYFAGRNDVSDIGDGADRVRRELADAEDSQSRTTESLNRASELADSAAGRNERIAEGNRKLQDSERGDEEIITESQRILERVRARGEAKD